jgi:long-chain acyl-CoA synthetase
MKGHFCWHEAARLFEGPAEVFSLASGGGVIAARPAGLALAQALAVPGAGFRIGGAGDLEAGAGEFETLTSGSSGAPRRILRSMASWLASFAINARLFGIGPGVRVAVLGGLEQSLTLYGALEALHLGAELHLLGGMRPDRQAAALSALRVEVLYATPAQLRLMVEAGPFPPLRLVVVGGSKLDPGLRVALGPVEGREFYGAAEASFITLSGPGTPEASVGAPYPGVEVEVREGEVWVRSPYLFRRYAGEDPGGAIWRDGWLSVGERGRMESGFLYLSGRAGRMVTVADQNVFPEEIELFLIGLPGVERAAVLPRPDSLRGVHLVAVLRGDRRQEGAILAACRARLGALKAPKAVIWREDWPVLPSGKTDFGALMRESSG